ncbi:hypothetical protein CVT24_010605 [Panaeolus cyanescens]|uniref:Chromate ion transporter n=1 Tax=Panaeolus cyanescens TaxID=181874 RepID=A0A409YLS5_9AGAR|nr:hypothetical protein CVT24_010605 [Panaeolus cyanescens]
MSFNAFVHSLFRRAVGPSRLDNASPYEANTSKLTHRLLDVFLRTYDLGFTSFGGPPVHFQIFHRRFVDGLGKAPWINEQTVRLDQITGYTTTEPVAQYQELFAISQALPGPASTKMLFNIAQIHAGLLPAIFVFIIWSLPGAIAMFGLSLGVERIKDTLPGPAYALLSGLNAATVGIIGLAAVQLSRNAITDKVTRIWVVFGACAGMCYNSLWYFPVLLVGAGLLTLFWDTLGRKWLNQWKRRRQRARTPEPEPESGLAADDIVLQDVKPDTQSVDTTIRRHTTNNASGDNSQNPSSEAVNPQPKTVAAAHKIPVKVGLGVIAVFFIVFTVFMVLRGTIRPPPLLLALFNNMILAGTIIFGGGPVVIPLLRSYVVDPGWVSPRDFLLGLAVIQAMPGPNFNFAVYLGALVIAGPASTKSVPSVVGALLAFIGIFTPGLWLSVGFQSLWRSLRKWPEVVSILRGVNAAAVGFIYTAVYRLWEIGYLTPQESKGVSLGQEPWWLVIAATTFTAVEWFSIPPPVAILAGGTAGLGWWGAVGRHSSAFLG